MRMESIKPVEIMKKLIELRTLQQGSQAENQKSKKTVRLAEPNNRLLDRQIQQLIEHPRFEGYRLTSKDVMVIVDLWRNYLHLNGHSTAWHAVCASAKIPRYATVECMDYLVSLLERHIICFDSKVVGNYRANPLILQSAGYILSNDLMLRILDREFTNDLEAVMKEKWLGDEDFFHDLKQGLDFCYNSFWDKRLVDSTGRKVVLEYPILSTCLRLLKDRILSAPDSLGIKALVRQHKLNEEQLFVILMIMYHQIFSDASISESDLALSLAPDPRDRWRLQEQLGQNSHLVSSGLIGKDVRMTRFGVSGLIVRPEILESIGYEASKTAKEASKLSPYFQRCQPTQTLEDVVLPASDKQLICQIITRCDAEKRKCMEKWGFQGLNNKQGVVLLLYGDPGTGKTYTAGAIANELQKELITLNVPELRDKFYGETEKLIKEAFTEMRKMAAEDENPPVFLLNEADQLIHTRVTSYHSSCSTVENSIQSIILEELETFPGILILTTNLETNLDEAFFRRFDLKFRFALPDFENRLKLWKLFLKTDIPGSEYIDIELLAKQYRFSGAQIALVIQNACVEAIGREDKYRFLGLHDLLKYAELEQQWSQNNNKSIGF
jgi:AAA+ superfamily predicted ATPase